MGKERDEIAIDVVGDQKIRKYNRGMESVGNQDTARKNPVC